MKTQVLLSILIYLLSPAINAHADFFYWESEYEKLNEELELSEKDLEELQVKYNTDTKKLESRITVLQKQIDEMNSKIETLQLVLKSKN
ncbi:MAG TPA: hypothetical protein VF857_02005 [Spirochaetota bacterium]